jgi:hypothetical protein
MYHTVHMHANDFHHWVLQIATSGTVGCKEDLNG